MNKIKLHSSIPFWCFNQLSYFLVRCLSSIQPGIKQINWFAAIYAVFKALEVRNHMSNIQHFRKNIGCEESNLTFLTKYFIRRSSDAMLGRLLCESPEYYFSCIEIEGEEHVQKLTGLDRGVLVLGSHGGPVMLRSFLFWEKFGIPLGSFASKKSYIRNQNRQPLLARDRLLKSMPFYSAGQEKKLLQGILGGEWVNMLIDYKLNSQHPVNCYIAGRHAALSEFPFRISLKYNIPILFTGIIRSQNSDKVLVNIQPLTDFNNPTEGLGLYVKNLEVLLKKDPYSNNTIPEWTGDG